MKLNTTLLTILAALTFSFTSAQAQKTGVVDIAKILDNITEYQEAQKQLDKIASEWNQEISMEYDKIKSLYNKYQAEQVLLSDSERKKREDEIMDKEKEVREMQKTKFGPEGDLYKKRQDLVEPIQAKVYKAITEFAEERGYDFIFDAGSASGIIFATPKFDITDDVMKKLGK